MKMGIDYVGVGCGVLIVDDAGKVLLMKRGKESRNEVGYWTKPGGKVEFGESPEEAVKREVREELGVEVEITQCLGYTDHLLVEEGQHWVALNFVGKIVAGEPKNLEADKCDEIGWFELDKLPDKVNITTMDAINQLEETLS